LADLGVAESHDAVELFFMRHDRNEDGLIAFSEFTDAFMPNESYYGSIVGRRTSSHKKVNPYRKEDIFEHPTACQLKHFLRSAIKLEGNAEVLRQSLARNPYFNLDEAFLLADLSKNGILSRDELRYLLEKANQPINDAEARTLTNKFDRDDDGLVTW